MRQEKSRLPVDKRGVSPLIASVLVIGMVVVVASIVFFWGKGFTEEIIEKEGTLDQKRLNCVTDVKINVLDGSSNEVTIENLGSARIDAFSLVSDGIAEETVDAVEPGNTIKVQHTAQGSKIDIIPKIRVAAGVYQPCSSQKLTYKI